LPQVCRLPVAALGLLQHSQSKLGDEAVYGEEKLVVVLPNHLSMLHRVACEQPGMIPKVGRRLASIAPLFCSGPEQQLRVFFQMFKCGAQALRCCSVFASAALRPRHAAGVFAFLRVPATTSSQSLC
jgi:hypothetical protein